MFNRAIVLLVCAGCWIGCADLFAPAPGGSGGSTGGTAGTDGVTSGTGGRVFAELEDLGLSRYVGSAVPSQQTVVNGVTVYTFNIADGPRCLDGSPYRVSVRDRGSDKLLIFLQGAVPAGAEQCNATMNANDVVNQGMPRGGILNPNLSVNPARDWNVVYLPYCDGSLFAGDADVDRNGDGSTDRYQHGLQNLSAGLHLAKSKSATHRKLS
ncbi:MAG: pectin acetylesterase-family hydrolase [Polyangiales bacterium]